MGSDQYCLKWNNHWDNLIQVFNALLRSETFVDVTLACEGRHLKAHRLVLSACSSYFKSLLLAHPDKHPVVILKDVRYAELEILVQFIYNGQVSVAEEDLAGVLETARELQIKGLTENGVHAVPLALLSRVEGDSRKDASPLSSALVLPVRSVLPSSAPDGLPSQKAPSGGSRDASPERKKLKVSSERDPPAGEGVLLPHPEASRPHSRGPSTGSQDHNDHEESAARNAAPSADGPPRAPPSEPESEEEDEDEEERTDRESDEEDRLAIQCPEVILEEDAETKSNGSLPTPPKMPSCTTNTFPPPEPSIMTPHSPQFKILHQTMSLMCSPFRYDQLTLTDFMKVMKNNSNMKQIPGIYPSLSLPPPPPPPLPAPPPVPPPPGTHKVDACSPPVLDHRDVSKPEINELTCQICARIMPNAQLLEEHIRIHEEEKPYKCEQCGQRYKYQTAFQRHQEQNHTAKLPGDKPYRCEVCGQCFKYHKSFSKHRSNHDMLDRIMKPDGEDNAKSTFRDIQEPYYQRFLQGETSKNELPSGPPVKQEKDEELKVEDDALNDSNQSGESDKCAIKEEREEELEVTPDISTEEPEEEDEFHCRFFSCSQCKVHFSTLSGFQEHCASSSECSIHNLKESTMRNSCHSQGSSPSLSPNQLGVHPSMDSSSPVMLPGPPLIHAQLPCIPAPGLLTSPAMMAGIRAPYSSHTIPPPDAREEERPFKCPYCQKGFKGRENLKLHIRTHTGEKPYNCGVCGKAFGGRSDMNRHLRIHTGEKPYPCKVCGKKFARADYLSKHITTHLGIPFAKPVHSLQQSLQNLENMQNLQNLHKLQTMHNLGISEPENVCGGDRVNSKDLHGFSDCGPLMLVKNHETPLTDADNPVQESDNVPNSSELARLGDVQISPGSVEAQKHCRNSDMQKVTE